MRTYLQWLLWIVCVNFLPLSAQVFDPAWEQTLYDLPNFAVNQVFQAFDGKLAVVGEMQTDDDASKGVFLLIDESNGKIIRQNSALGMKRFNRLNTGLQAEDGTFYLAGSTGNELQDQDAWLLRITGEGQVLKDTLIASRGNDAFERIALFSDGSLLLAGYKNSPDNLWVLQWQRDRIAAQNNYKNARIGKLLELVIDVEDGVDIFGGSERPGDIWRIRFDRKLARTEEPFFKNIARSEPVFADFISANSLYVFGNSWRGSNDDDLWFCYVNTATGDVSEKIIGSRNPEFVRAAVRIAPGRYLLSMSALGREAGAYSGELFNHLVVFDTRQQQIVDTIALIGSERKTMVTLLRQGLRRTTWVVADVAAGQNRFYTRIICRKPTQVLARAKAMYAVKCSQPELRDEDGDGRLAPGERGAIVFFAENTGDADIEEAELTVRGIPPVMPGLELVYETLFVSSLPKGEKRRLSVPVAAAANLAAGTSVFEISLKVKGNTLAKFNAPVLSVKSIDSGSAVRAIDYKTPQHTTGSRSARSPNDKIAATGKVYADRIIPQENFRTYVNGHLVVDAKNEFTQFEVHEENGLYVHLFTTVLSLHEGDNTAELRVMADGVETKSDPIFIRFVPRKPNLHIIAIAPPYKDLKYNRKDADDLIAALEQQKEKGIYDEITVTRLNTEITANRTQIQLAFKRLVQQATAATEDRAIFEKDIILVFISSHGTVLNRRFKIVPGDYDGDFPEETTVDYRADILEQLEKIRCKKIVLIDACHSGGARSRAIPGEIDLNKALEELSRIAEGVTTISSSQENELSYEEPAWENGAFTQALLDALANKPIALPGKDKPFYPDANEDLFLSIEELYQYVRLRVPGLIQEVFQKNADLMKQNPTLIRNDLGKETKVFVVE
ncbi:MAG: caspase family protein [Saprospiraceae bacterium]|nr:caspase family protein [Saprospiraceae bacterium]